MFRVNLMDLDRAGSVRVQREIESTSALWDDADLDLAGPVDVQLVLTATASGQVVARGRIQARLDRRCRRCLEPVESELDQELNLVWVPPDQLEDEDEDEAGGEVRRLDASSNELKLGEAIREEVILAAPTYVVCSEECQGLCPRCGINRNETSCDCTLTEPDPRWDALRALQQD